MINLKELTAKLKPGETFMSEGEKMRIQIPYYDSLTSRCVSCVFYRRECVPFISCASYERIDKTDIIVVNADDKKG